MLTLRKVLALTCIVVSSVVAANAQSGINPEYHAILSRDGPGGADNPLTGRYEGSVLLGQHVAAFNELMLPSGPATGKTYDNDRKFTATVRVQGKVAQ